MINIQASGPGGLVLGLVLFIALACALVRIVQKAGYSGWWVLVLLVPFLNLAMFFVFAFSKWPVLRRERVEEPEMVNGSLV